MKKHFLCLILLLSASCSRYYYTREKFEYSPHSSLIEGSFIYYFKVPGGFTYIGKHAGPEPWQEKDYWYADSSVFYITNVTVHQISGK